MSSDNVPSFEELLSPDSEQMPSLPGGERHSSLSGAGVGSQRCSESDLEAGAPGVDSLGQPGDQLSDSRLADMMETVLLEGSPMEESIDLGGGNEDLDTESDLLNDEVLTDDTDPGDSDLMKEIEAELTQSEATHPPVGEATPSAPKPETEANSPEAKLEEAQPDISMYFECSDTADDFPHFGVESVAAQPGEKSEGSEGSDLDLREDDAEVPPTPLTDQASGGGATGAAVEADAPADHEGERAPSTGVRGHARVTFMTQTSVTEDAVPVTFEESKGMGIKPTPSTKSLTKYFSESDEAADNEGKTFFDTFTAAEGESSSLGMSQSPHPGAGFPAGMRSRHESLSERPEEADHGLVPPETPPIPSSASPMPSPFHRMGSTSDERSEVKGSSSRTTSLSESSLPAAYVTPIATPPGSAEPLEIDPPGDDPFTASINMSDVDRRHDAWIPSEVTQQVLHLVVTSAPGTYLPPAEQLTMPGVVVVEPQGDPIQDLVLRFVEDQETVKRRTMAADDVTQDEIGVRQLIKSECWRSAVDLTGRLLAQNGQGPGTLNQSSRHTPYTLQLWLTRLSLLVKLHLYSHAESEMAAFGNMDHPDLYYEYYPDKYGGRRGSMVPFHFRILHAELPLYVGKPQESLDRLYYIHAIVERMLGHLESGKAEDGSGLVLSEESRKASRELWESRDRRILYAIGNCLLSIKDYASAISVFEDLLKKEDTANRQTLRCGIGRILLQVACHTSKYLIQQVGRILLQIGDIKAAEKYFAQVEKTADAKTPRLSSRKSMNEGYLSLANGQFADAYQTFKEAVRLDPTNAVAINNMAVCSLYTGRLRESINTLEGLVHSDPQRYLQEGILFNLCTLYELESSHAIHKKKLLLSLVSKYKGNGFNVACLKMA